MPWISGSKALRNISGAQPEACPIVNVSRQYAGIHGVGFVTVLMIASQNRRSVYESQLSDEQSVLCYELKQLRENRLTAVHERSARGIIRFNPLRSRNFSNRLKRFSPVSLWLCSTCRVSENP
jgi:hypothetical protein